MVYSFSIIMMKYKSAIYVCVCMKVYIWSIIFQKIWCLYGWGKSVRTDDYSHNILWSWQENPFGAKTFFFQWFTRWKLFWQIIDKMLPPPPSVCNQSIRQKVVTLLDKKWSHYYQFHGKKGTIVPDYVNPFHYCKRKFDRRSLCKLDHSK